MNTPDISQELRAAMVDIYDVRGSSKYASSLSHN
jgi:hypothetical protein